jgi:hypothetical protein
MNNKKPTHCVCFPFFELISNLYWYNQKHIDDNNWIIITYVCEELELAEHIIKTIFLDVMSNGLYCEGSGRYSTPS